MVHVKNLSVMRSISTNGKGSTNISGKNSLLLQTQADADRHMVYVSRLGEEGCLLDWLPNKSW
jgi:hypothetical protein